MVLTTQDYMGNFSISDLFKKDVIVVYRNDVDKRFHLSESQSMIGHVKNMFATQLKGDKFSQLKKDIESGKVVLEIIEIEPDKFIRRTKLVKYIEYYRDMGYNEYVSITRSTKPVIKMQIVNNNKRSFYVLVYMLLGTRPKTILGTFNKVEEAKKFMRENYPGNKLGSKGLVIADNDLTTEFIATRSFDFNNSL